MKSYKGRFKSNWDDLSPERQAEIRAIWAEHEAEFIMRRIQMNPPKQHEAIFNAYIKQAVLVN